MMVAIVVSGVIVSRWGYYVPYMILGETVVIAGTVLLMHLRTDTPTVQWVVFLIVTGVGMGSAQQLPYTTVQTALSEADIPTGNAVMIFAWLIGGAISVAIGQNLCLDTLRTLLPQYTDEVSPSAAIEAGAYDLQTLAPSPMALAALRTVWNIAVTRTFTFSLAATCLAVPITACMEWKNSRKEAERRRKKAEDVPSERC